MDFYTDDNSFVKVNYISDSSISPSMSSDIVILHVITGSARLSVGGVNCSLGEGDFFLINPNTIFEFRIEKTLCGIIEISSQRVMNLLGKIYAEFVCGPEQKGDPSYARLEGILWKIYEASLLKDNSGRIQMLSLSYQLADMISSSFMLDDENRKGSASENDIIRDAQIMNYINASFAESITLDMLAKELFLSNAYLSKYIKKHFRMNYVDLLNSVRLNHATETLKNSNESVTRIAMSNGFSSVAAFNRAFKDAYGTNPADYRKTYRASYNESGRKKEDSLTPEIRETIESAIQRYKERERASDTAILISEDVDALARGKETFAKSWKKVINIGTAYTLTRSDFQKQLLFLHDKIGYEYIRFWDVFSPELRINIHADPKSINFHTLFMVIDFLIDNGMKPFMELGIKPIRIVRNTADAVIDTHRNDQFSSLEELHEFIAEFARQLVSRYGQREVSSWYFEYWKKDPMLFYVSNMLQANTEENREKYLAEFDALCAGIKAYIPGARIGGGGFTYRSYGEDGIRAVFQEWKKHEYQPDFISFNCFCYKNVILNDNEFHQKRYEDKDYINKVLQDAKRLMRETGFGERKIYVTEFNLTVSNRCPINDSCNKASELMQLILGTMNNTEILSYWTALDAYSEYSDTTAVVFGGVGLLSKDGIPKPAYYTYDFINRLDDDIMERTEDYIISRQGTDSFKIVCHNFRGFSEDLYDIEQEDTVDIKDISGYSRDQREKHIRLTFHNIPNGKYQIRIREIDGHSGSVQDVWKRLNYDDRLDREDVNFIRQMCIPSMWRMETEVFNGSMEFELKLAPNSIKYAHFVLKKA